MLVSVIFEKRMSYEITIEVPDDATTDQVEHLAYSYENPPEWLEDYSGILRMEAVDGTIEDPS
jgi:hypothetical protein